MNRFKVLFQYLVVFAGFFLVLSTILISRPFSFSEPPLFNPGRGFSLAILVCLGPTFGIPLILASFVANIIFLKHTLLAAFLLGLNNFLAMWLGATLMKKFCDLKNPSENIKDWAKFLFLVLPICLLSRFSLDSLVLPMLKLELSGDWKEIYLPWIWIDSLGIILSFPFFMELFDFIKTRKKIKDFAVDLFPFFIGNLMGVFVFFDPGFDKFGLPQYLPFYLALAGMIGISYFVSPLLLSFSVLFQGYWAAWGREGVILGNAGESENGRWALRVFLFALGILTPVLSSLFRKDNEEAFKKSFSLVSSALGSTNSENDLIRVASKSDTVAVGVFDMNYRVLHLNEKFAAIAGTPIEAQIGKTSEERTGPNSWHMRELFDKIKKTGKPIWNYRLKFEAWQQMRQQELVSNYIPIFSKSGEVVGVIVVTTELSNLDKEQLLKNRGNSNNEENGKKVLALAVSHDLQEPLRNVNQALQILNEKFKASSDFEVKNFVESALDASSKIHAMIKSSLELANLDYRELKETRLNLQEVVQEILVLHRAQLRELAAQVSVETLPEIRGERELISYLIQNLLSNSIKYRSDHGLLVSVSGAVQGKMCRVCFSDNGIGFSNHDVDRVFAPYQRLHTNDEIPGYGIGLSICQKIVELHGGKIWAESQPGLGATFYFTLPVA